MKKLWGEYSQNKNFLMLITSIVYILGLFAFFSNNQILVCAIISSLFIISLFKNIFPTKVIMLWLFIFYFGFFNASSRFVESDKLFSLAPQNVEIIGQVVSIPNKSKTDTVRFFFNVYKVKLGDKIINIDKNKTLVNIRYTEEINSKPLIGNYYSIEGKLAKPFESTNPSQFSYRKYLKNYNAYTTFYCQNTDYFLIDKELSLKWKIVQNLNNYRIQILNSHSKYLKSPYLEILGGIVFGDDAIAPPENTKKSFVNSGLLHILAASGMNVAFIYGFLYFLLRKLKVSYKLSILSGISIIILYALMTGLGPSVVRASIMLIVILLGKLIDRDSHSISLLAFVALLMLIYNPAYINDVGFQLSFIVTFGLLLCTNIILGYFKNIPTWLSGTIFVPLIAQIWVAPIQMFYFNTISLYSVFANILSVPILSVVSFGGFVSSIFALIRPISDKICLGFDFVLNPFLKALVSISNYFASLPNSLIVTTHPSIFQIICYYVILILLIYLLKTKFESKNLLKISFFLLILLCISTINIPNKNLEIITFDVQNGDAFLIKSPQNKYFIIDTGKTGYKGSNSKAKMIILKYLNDKGIKNIDSLIITHFDSDHAGGAIDLIENININKIYVNSLTNTSDIAQNIYRKSTNIECITSKKEITKENNFSIILNKANINNSNNHDNENSIITLLKYNEFSMLFTGDAGITALNNIKNFLPHNITVFKLGHHGSAGVIDKNLINHIQPHNIIISVGPNNYGHPNILTLELINKIPLYRTDIDNSIKIIANKKSYKIYTYNSRTMKYELAKTCLY